MIASKTEIKALAFSNNFDIEAVKDNLIQVVEWEQVLPLLGTSLYDDVVANPSSYTTLLSDYLKPFIAYGVKAYVSKPNHIKTGNKGAQTAQGSNEQIASIQMAKREASKMVDSYKKLMVKYLDDSSIALWEGEPTNNGIINKIIII
tara:strand:+ start:716 stop:1156 length:441 start_codon:yes stop_codon:yes gene_type:complete